MGSRERRWSCAEHLRAGGHGDHLRSMVCVCIQRCIDGEGGKYELGGTWRRARKFPRSVILESRYSHPFTHHSFFLLPASLIMGQSRSYHSALQPRSRLCQMLQLTVVYPLRVSSISVYGGHGKAVQLSVDAFHTSSSLFPHALCVQSTPMNWSG